MEYKKKLFSFFLLTLIFLNGCSDKKQKEATFKTVVYYDEHIEERNDRIKECESNQERTRNTLSDCQNAIASYDNEKRGVPLDW